MLYSNTTLKAKDLTLDFGTIRVVTLGEYGRGRSPINFCVPSDVEEIQEGLTKGLSIGTARSGKPRIISGDDSSFTLLIDTRLGYTRRGDGTVKVWDPTTVEVRAKGNSADGDAGRIGYADARVIRVLETAWLKIRMGGGYTPYFLYCVPKEGKVMKIEKENMADALDAGVPVPDGWDWVEKDSWGSSKDKWTLL